MPRSNYAFIVVKCYATIELTQFGEGERQRNLGLGSFRGRNLSHRCHMRLGKRHFRQEFLLQCRFNDVAENAPKSKKERSVTMLIDTSRQANYDMMQRH